jgi:hypothetical protein
MQSQTPEEKAAAEKRWPHISKALEMESMLQKIKEWTKTNPPTGEEALVGMRKCIMDHLTDAFLTAPPAEVADALAEMVSADLMKKLIDMGREMFGEPKDNTDSFAE